MIESSVNHSVNICETTMLELCCCPTGGIILYNYFEGHFNLRVKISPNCDFKSHHCDFASHYCEFITHNVTICHDQRHFKSRNCDFLSKSFGRKLFIINTLHIHHSLHVHVFPHHSLHGVVAGKRGMWLKWMQWQKPLTGLCMSYEEFPSPVMSHSSQREGMYCRVRHGFVLIPQHCACQVSLQTSWKACVPHWQGQCSMIPLLPGGNVYIFTHPQHYVPP